MRRAEGETPTGGGSEPPAAAPCRPTASILRGLTFLPAVAAHVAIVLTSTLLYAQSAPDPVTPPAVLARVDASYPPTARAAGIQGTVVLAVTVLKDGTVGRTEVLQSAGAELDAAAIEAAHSWTFLPARRAATTIASRIRVSFRFDAQAHPPQALPPAEPLGKAAVSKTDTSGAPTEVRVTGSAQPRRGASEFQIEVGELANIPRQSAAELVKLAPGFVITNEGGSEFGQHTYLRGFAADEGQDFEFSVDGIPINESGNIDTNGFADSHFIVPELVESLRVVEGPFDPRQGNFAVAGSVDYELGLERRDLTSRYTVGSFGTNRELLTWGPVAQSSRTFLALDLYSTQGFGENRDGRHATAIGQYEGKFGVDGIWRVTGTAYANQFHSAGEVRADDVDAGRIGFYGTYDARQGGVSERYSVAGMVETRAGVFTLRQQLFVIERHMELRENFTGFLENPLLGDLAKTLSTETTIGARGLARVRLTAAGVPQDLELGYFARGDDTNGTIQRIAAPTNVPYATDGSLQNLLGDVGIYGDASLRASRWLSLRAGPRVDLFMFDVLDRVASRRTVATSVAAMPRATLLLGPFESFMLSASYGMGERTLDPQSVADGTRPLFSTVDSVQAGVSYTRSLPDWNVDARSDFFDTVISEDTIFSETAGRTIPTKGTIRTGWAGALRLTGAFLDESGSLTLTRCIYDDTRLPVPFTPTSVLRSDTVVFAPLPWRLRGRAFRGTLGAAVTFVGPRPLPYAQTSDPIFTLDAYASLRWTDFELALSSMNVLGARYALGEFNYVSDWHTQAPAPLAPERTFSAGAPRSILLTLGVSLDEGGCCERRSGLP